jgi:glycosyltransferase involved in cell wall biosynthesis
MERCRLLYIVGQLGLGGLERQLYYLLANLDHARYRPAVVVWNVNRSEKYYTDIEALKVPVYGFPPEWSISSKLLKFRVLVRQVTPEVIHSYGFPTNFIAYYGARCTSALAIGSLRADFSLCKAEDGVIRGMLNGRWPSSHISNSRTAAESARRHSGPFAPKQIMVVRNGLDLNVFSYSAKTFGTRNYVAAVGSLLPVKRWDRLLRAIKEIKSKKSKIGEVRFRIAGDGPLRTTLENLAGELGIAQDVEFMGELHDIPSFLSQAKFLVHTSASEGCPNAVMEAMACGLPVVALEAGDIPYLVEEARTGFVVRQDDDRGLADRITQLLTDEGLSLSMGAASREKAEWEFSLQRLVSETLSAYRIAGWRHK